MEKVSNDGQSRRGESTLEVKEDFQNNIENHIESENEVEQKQVDDVAYSEHNSELDSFLDEATTTKAQQATQERELKVSASKYMSVEAAADISIKGLAGLTKMASEYSGNEIEISQESAMLFATLTAPLIQKYGAKISFDPNNVDLESWMPEMMALGGVAVVGYPMFKQMKKPKPVVDSESDGAKNGDKS